MECSHRKFVAWTIAIDTQLGLVLSGPVPQYDLEKSAVNLAPSFVLHSEASCQGSEDCLESMLKTFWDLETLRIHEAEASVYDQYIECIQCFYGSIASKARVCPLSGHTISKLELLAALLLCKLLKHVMQALEVELELEKPLNTK